MKRITSFVMACCLLALAGCSGSASSENANDSNERKVSTAAKGSSDTAVQELPSPAPAFSLATSEYPSWSTFAVADKAGLINAQQGGKPGSLETKWNVDVVLEVKDYDTCLTMYGNEAIDAVCMTNVDAVKPALSRQSTAILATSTSAGGDKVIAVGIDKPEDLKGKITYGLKESVSQYVFYRGLEKQGLDPREFQYESLDPAACAIALQTSSDNVSSICVWNPFALETLRKRTDSKTLFTSELLPREVIDMVVMANKSLKKDGGDRFAACICDTFYVVNQHLNDPKTADVTLVALGENFCHLPANDMRICTEDTRFYGTPDAGIELFTDKKWQTETMQTVIKTDQAIEILKSGKTPKLGYNDPEADLNFSTKYMEMAKAKAE